MKRALAFILLTMLLASATWSQDARYGGPPTRNADGTIARSRQVLRDFQAIHPCPANGRKTGACPGWFKDHVIPLKCRGVDAIENLQWLPGPIKTCSGTVCKDRWERRVYCRHVPPPSPVTPPTPTPTTTETETSP